MVRPRQEQPETDVLEQEATVVPEEDDDLTAPETPEADPADVMDQRRVVPYDEE